MRTAMMLLALALAVAPGCKKKDETAASQGSGSAMAGSGSAMAGSGSAMAGSGSGSDMAGSGSAGSGSAMAAGSGSDMAGSGSGSASEVMMHHAGNCPSTVLGAKTRAEVKGKAVNVIISADDKDAVVAIQKRTEELLKEKKPGAGGGSAHDQKGTHGGSMGICPVYVPEGATAKSGKLDAKLGDGVMVTITPKDKPDALKAEIDARIAKADEWVKANIKPGDKGNMGGVGGGKADEGMNRSGKGDGKGLERKKGDGSGGGKGTGGGGGKGTGGGSGSAKK